MAGVGSVKYGLFTLGLAEQRAETLCEAAIATREP